ncbi:carbon monoxide dehydrogenase accessory protein CooC [soil metagenome]
MRVAVVGKGGAGKSVVTGTIARLLARRGRKVLALDSDPMPGLALSLGLGPVTTAMLAEAAEKDADGRWRLKKGVGAARAVQRHSLLAPDGVRLLQFGKPSSEGMAPLMGSLNAFYQVAHRLARGDVLRDWVITGDLPAGPRQAAFNWAPYAKTFLVVVEPTWQSILSARRIGRIARAGEGVTTLFIANKVRSTSDVAFVAEHLRDAVWASVPADDAVRDADRRGVALLDHVSTSPAIAALEDLAEELERRAEEGDCA